MAAMSFSNWVTYLVFGHFVGDGTPIRADEIKLVLGNTAADGWRVNRSIDAKTKQRLRDEQSEYQCTSPQTLSQHLGSAT